jgi:hypothetical protein
LIYGRWRVETFKFSTDPELVAKVTDVIGLYLAPPENAIVLCVDEKSQIQVRAFIDGWNDRCHPFVWTKTADEVRKKANRQITSNTVH